MYNVSAIERGGITIYFAQEQSSPSIAVTIQLQIIIISIYLITLSFSLSLLICPFEFLLNTLPIKSPSSSHPSFVTRSSVSCACCKSMPWPGDWTWPPCDSSAEKRHSPPPSWPPSPTQSTTS